MAEPEKYFIKCIEPSIEKVLRLLTPATYTVKLPGHYLNEKTFEIKKGDRKYEYFSSAPTPKGHQLHNEIQFERNTVVEFNKTGLSLFTLGKHILLSQITYGEDMKEKIFSGSINSFSTKNSLTEFDGKYHRMIIPIAAKGVFSIILFERKAFKTIKPKEKYFTYIPLLIKDENYHVFDYKLGDNVFLIIDSIQPSTLKVFQQKAFSILLSIGFINGNLISDECFILSFDKQLMEEPVATIYHSLGESINSGQATFTNNPFSVQRDYDFERDEKGMIKKEVIDKLNEGLTLFPIDVFSKLSTLFFEHDKLERAAMLYIRGHDSPLEVRVPNYFIAIEAITGWYISNNSIGEKLNPIKDSKLAGEMIKFIKEYADKIKTDKGLKVEEFNYDILLKNIEKLNAPPNADKLAGTFGLLKYNLSEEELEILKDRNPLLHGSFIKAATEDELFQKALHVALRQRFLIAVLLLKIAGFNGKIINYASLWSNMTGQSIEEERLISI
ncbi:MAG: hypothetical protein ACLQQ4_08385 [Bacteroidia bacterium]